MTKRRTFILSVFAAVTVVSCIDTKPKFNSVDITGVDYAKDFHLPDVDGQIRSLKDFAGKVVVVFFGFTQCPDVCPTTMMELAEVKKALGKDGNKVQGVFITLDPQRDTPQVLKPYIANFDPSFIALRPSEEQLALTARDFKVFHRKSEGKTPGSYSIDHTAASFVYDTQGRVRLYSRHGAGVKALADDIRKLL